jgi:hypothetical protein
MLSITSERWAAVSFGRRQRGEIGANAVLDCLQQLDLTGGASN